MLPGKVDRRPGKEALKLCSNFDDQYLKMSTELGIKNLESEINRLKNELAVKENLLKQMKNRCPYNEKLSTEEIVRYSRQMLIPEIHVKGQVALKNSKVLVVGIGGLGCPASLYLAAAGVGEITLMDYDEVELSNVHRQILHGEENLNAYKVNSAQSSLRRINSSIKIIPLKEHANSQTINDLLKKYKYDVILDGSDNVATRYLLNDACVLHKTPLVSGSALKMEGQLTVYNYQGGPCYRCLFPCPPPAFTVTNCGDGGVLGPVSGVIGVLQALESIKVITKSMEVLSGSFLIFDGFNCSFRKVKLRQRNLKCSVCGDEPSITSLIDYEQFCGSSAHDKVVNKEILLPNQHVGVEILRELGKDSVVIDVRPILEFEMCSLPNSVNFPCSEILKNMDNIYCFLLEKFSQGVKNFYIICRRGNDSQTIVALLCELALEIHFFNIKGGLHAYSKFIDSSFPNY